MNPFGRDYIPFIVALLLEWLQTFISVANANLAQTGLTAGQVTALNDLATDLSTAHANQQALKSAAKAATATKKLALRAAVAEARTLAQIVQKHPGASEALKIELGLTAPPAPHVPVEPQLPGPPTAVLGRIGWVTLKWAREGNKYGTMFVIEYRVGNDGPFSILTVVTKSKYVDKNRTPGVQVWYRVKAVRDGRESGYTEPVSIYTPIEQQQQLSLQIAA